MAKLQNPKPTLLIRLISRLIASVGPLEVPPVVKWLSNMERGSRGRGATLSLR